VGIYINKGIDVELKIIETSKFHTNDFDLKNFTFFEIIQIMISILEKIQRHFDKNVVLKFINKD
jgi:hypothetical protein